MFWFVTALCIPLGVGLRWGLDSARRPWLLTLGLAALTAVLWWAARALPGYGSEGPGLLVLWSALLTAGSLISGAIRRSRR